VLEDGCNSTGQNFDLDEQSSLLGVAVVKSDLRLEKVMNLQIAEPEQAGPVGLAVELLQLQVGRWQMQDALDAVKLAR
jgi:hypothetical protein